MQRLGARERFSTPSTWAAGGRRPVPTHAPGVCSVVGAALLVLAGAGWGGSSEWFGPDTPLGPTRIGSVPSHLVSLTGLGLLVLGWLGTGVLVAAGRVSTRGVVFIAGATGIPLLIGPPLFSSDALTYVGIGELVDRGGNAYTQGWGATGRSDYVGRLPEFWRDTPSPYSPLSLRLVQLVARVSGGDLDRGALILRSVAVLAVVVTGVLVVRSARRVGASPAGPLWLAVANPVVLLGGVSGAHLDVLVAPLLVIAFLLLDDLQPLLAGLALGLAAQVKATAFVAVAVVAAWSVVRERDRPRLVGLTACAVAVAVFVAVTELCRLGWGWTATLGVPGSSNNSQTPIDALSDLAHRAGLGAHHGPVSMSGANRTTEYVALTVAAVGCLALVCSRQLRAAGAAGWALVLVSVLSGAVWFWYLIPALGLLARGPAERGRRWTWAGLAGVCVLTLIGLTPSGAPAASLQTPVGDVVYLVGYALVAGVVTVGFRQDRAGYGQGPMSGVVGQALVRDEV